MKKISIFLSLCTILLCSPRAWAYNATVSSASANPGQPANVTVSFSGNNLSVYAIDLWLQYDATALQLNSVTQGAGSSALTMVSNTASAGEAKIAFYGVNPLSAASGVMISFNFTVLSSAQPGTHSLHLSKMVFSTDTSSYTPTAQTDGVLTVLSSNRAPVANAQSVTTSENTAKAITLSATDADGDALTYSVVGSPAHGTLSGSAPNVTYTPTANYNGSDSFTFKANDGKADSNTATVSITVTAVNDAPVLAAIGNKSVDKGKLLSFSISATDGNGDALTYSASGLPASASFNPSTKTFSWTPTSTQSGIYYVIFNVTDGKGGSDSETIMITVVDVSTPNRAPVANAQSVTTSENTAKAITLSATDADGDALTYSVVGSPAHGTLSGSAPNVTYTPTANYNGSDSFTFKANDGKTDSNTAAVSIAVTAVNDAPVLAAIGNKSVDKGKLLSFSISATDGNGDALTYSASGLPASASFNPSTKTFSWTPTSTQSGIYYVIFNVTDGKGGSDSETIMITVVDVATPNRAPVANAQSVTTNEDTAKAITLSATDADGDALTYSVVASPAHGSLSGTTPNVMYTPATSYKGSDSFTFKANDGKTDSNTAAVSIAVTAVNDAPVLAAIGNKSVDKGKLLSFSISATDGDGDALTYSASGLPVGASFNPSTRTFSWTPTSTVSGNYNVTFNVTDGKGGSDSETIMITVVDVSTPNRAPVANAQSVTTKVNTAKAITLLATDADGNSLKYSVVASPAHGSLSGTAPNVMYTPATNYNGSDSFTFKANDGKTDSNTAAVSITVTAATTSNNHPPVFGYVGNKTVLEGKGLIFYVMARDNDQDVLTYSAANLPPGATFDSRYGLFKWIPNYQQAGTYNVTFMVSDGKGGSDQTTITIQVINVK